MTFKSPDLRATRMWTKINIISLSLPASCHLEASTSTFGDAVSASARTAASRLHKLRRFCQNWLSQFNSEIYKSPAMKLIFAIVALLVSADALFVHEMLANTVPVIKSIAEGGEVNRKSRGLRADHKTHHSKNGNRHTRLVLDHPRLIFAIKGIESLHNYYDRR